jgi:precorrin-6B methylase 2
MLITEDYRAEQAALHAKGNYGTASLQYGETVAALLDSTQARSLLDYGCGSKRSLLKALTLPDDIVYEGYDPAVPAYAAPPLPAGLVCCIDVLEHIEPSLLENVLGNLAELCDPYGFFTVHTGPAQKNLSDGRNAHLTQQGADWWLPRLKTHFEVLALRSIPSGFVVVVRSLKSDTQLPLPGPLVLPAVPSKASPSAAAPAPVRGSEPDQGIQQLVLKYKGERLVFIAPDTQELQHVQSCLKEQSDTMQWLESLPVGSTLLDVGAGSGAHAVFAAVMRKATAFVYEPEQHKAELLSANARANGVASRIVAVTRTPLQPSLGTIDEWIASDTIPMPDAIKVSVRDGALETLQGGATTLRHPKLAQLLVNLDMTLDEHKAAARWLGTLGFKPNWPSSGSTNAGELCQGGTSIVFIRSDQPWHKKFSISTGGTARGRSVLRHVLARVAAAEVIDDPFPYSVIDGILPNDYYAEALAHFPSPDSLRPLGETGRVQSSAYRERLVVLFTDEEFGRMTHAQQRFWREFADWMYSDVFLNAFVMKFHQALEPRLARILGESDALRARGDALLVNDQTNYAIGPHTDAPHRLVTFLFYLPRDASMRELGTSVYRPKDPNFVCWGGPHHPFDKFDFVRTVEYLPNRLLAFPKTERSFHGVGQINRLDVNRPLLINNIRLLNAVTH